MKTTLLAIIFTLFVSCLPEEVPTTTAGENNSNASSSTDDDTTSSLIYNSNAKWLNSGLSSQTLTLNVDNAKSVHIIGDDVHSYLGSSENFNATYCLEATFTQTNLVSPKRIRVKVVPDLTNNFTQGLTARFLRVNLSSVSGNDFCNKSSLEIVNGVQSSILPGDSDQDGDVDANDTSIVYQTADVCTNCSNILSSSKVKLYKYNTSTDLLENVDTSLIEYDPMVLRIDMNSNSDDGGSSCSNSGCQASGFDCCLQDQCVNEKGIKVSGVEADPTAFTLAEQEKYTNANWYKKYPQFYYICLESVPGTTDPDPVTPTDPNGDADTRLQELISDYECIEELDANSDADPFHINAYDSSKTYTKCDVSNTSATLYYQEVMKRMYQNCGCEEQTDLNQMISTCPAYTYEPIFATDTDGAITTTVEAIECITPSQPQTPLPFSNLEIPVSSKSAPHRFFDTNGIEIDPEATLPVGATGTQEGEEFQYLDDDKIFPNNGSFNMNSILGQMTTSLDFARPARVIDLEFDKQYYISTRSGYYSPCPNCAKDSWFSNFTATPISTYGLGVRATGHTTRRDTYETNTSLGNYEDTIFGRACFLPPTMIPFGHAPNTDVKTQRLNRLQTQAALFMNGYQRDWFGFNKGALIGSFDGISWFAVGPGRIVRSTSTKLFLAINAPFADLASPTDHIVSVQEYDFTSTGALFDYDPTKEVNDSTQNQAGLCQKYHECETDSHCITKLGWEYTCADVTTTRTKWPKFDPTGASELANEYREGTIVDFLQQASLPPGSGTKRCIYRGAGAPCRVDYQNITDQGLRENLTCAPNFYCAKIDTSNAFNKEVSRFGRSLEEIIESKNHYFGQDANLLGRPKNYVYGTSLTSLPTNVKTNLKENIILTDSGATNQMGLCRPGKKLPSYATADETSDWNPADQHAEPDTSFRTDYISQIGSCNSALYTDLRYSSCPMLDETGNYVHTQDTYINDQFEIPDLTGLFNKQYVTERYSFAQNSCGLESLDSSTAIGVGISSDTLAPYSAFKSIEGRTLATSDIQIEKTLAQNACLRKAGAVCHTDLDCSPNRLQASVVDLVAPSFFGNTAEKTYYEEYLICGQSDPIPNVGDDNFDSFNIHNNRCCRPVGSDITMYTEDSPNALESQGIRTDKFGSLHPSDATRYSRYSVVDSQVDSTTKLSNIIRPTANKEDSDNDKIIDNPINITSYNQWRTIHTAAAKTCCGGSWIRKFADGTNNWQINRLNMDISKFKCLNNRSALYLTENPTAYSLTSSQLDSDRGNFCTDPVQGEGGCVAIATGGIEDFDIEEPTLNMIEFDMILDTDDTVMESQWATNLWTFAQLIPYDAGEELILDWSKDEVDVQRKALITRLPSFIAFDTIADITVQLEDNAGAYQSCSRIAVGGDATNPIGLTGPLTSWTPGFCSAPTACCYHYNESTRVIRVAPNTTTVLDPTEYDTNDRSLKVTFTAPGTLHWEKEKIPAGASVSDQSYIDHRRSSTPGNALYYLKRLAHFEYIGIPQMVYEPIYCNDNYQKLVPGLFKDEAFGQKLETVVDFLAHGKTFTDTRFSEPWNNDSASGNYNANSLNQQIVADQELVEHSPIFSDNKFKCCKQLGETVTDQAMCCSGYAVSNEGETTNNTCKLPNGTNLNVYFNKFVSGEGIDDDMPVAALDTEDFDSRTGEPILSTSVLAKLTALGGEYCESGAIRRGGAFGPYDAEPLSTRSSQSSNSGLYSIIDNFSDNSNINNQQVGYQVFSLGYRWNHHVYCDLQSE